MHLFLKSCFPVWGFPLIAPSAAALLTPGKEERAAAAQIMATNYNGNRIKSSLTTDAIDLKVTHDLAKLPGGAPAAGPQRRPADRCPHQRDAAPDPSPVVDDDAL